MDGRRRSSLNTKAYKSITTNMAEGICRNADNAVNMVAFNYHDLDEESKKKLFTFFLKSMVVIKNLFSKESWMNYSRKQEN